MDKPAPTDFPIHDVLQRRWSPRAFDERLVEPDTLVRLFEAARWAPSCFNEQPWRFIVATRDQPESFQRLVNCLVESNAVWAGRAPVLMLSVAAMRFEETGKDNRHAFHDVGLAVENLVIQATAMGLFAHQMAGFHIEKARIDLEIPAGYEPVAMIAVGYPGDPDRLPEKLRQREQAPRERRPVGEFVFSGMWGRRS